MSTVYKYHNIQMNTHSLYNNYNVNFNNGADLNKYVLVCLESSCQL